MRQNPLATFIFLAPAKAFNHSEQGHFYHVNVVTNPSDSNCVVFFFCPKLSVWT